MKPVAFEVVRPASLPEAAQLLAAHDEAAKVMAGGQSLGPMLNLRLARPSLIVDITGISELTQFERGADHITLGACVTTANVEDGRAGAETLPMLATVARRIAYRAVRNRGTLGGSLCHADPASDWMTTLAALGADATISDGTRRRTIAIARFMLGAYETVLQPGEILEAVRIPNLSPNARWGYYKVCRKAGEFALAIGAVVSDPDRDVLRAVVGATNGAPLVADDARALFVDGRDLGALDEKAVVRLFDGSRAAVDDSRRRLHLIALARAAEEARSR